MIQNKRSNQRLAERIEFFSSAKERALGFLKYKTRPGDLAGVFLLPFFGLFPLVHTFGMKFSIDILFCDSKKKIISVFNNVGPNRFIFPWRYALGGSAYLIELSEPTARDLRIGDELVWSDP